MPAGDLLIALILVGTFGTTAMIWREVRQYRRQVKELGENLKRFIRASAEREFKQTEALITLTSAMKLPHPIPRTRGWAASPDLLLLLYRLTIEKKPALIVECGSGVSTLVLAKAASTYGGRVVSLDHSSEFAAATRSELESQGLFADVRWAPLVSTELGPWYDQSAISDLQAIDFLFVDGPPADSGPHARYPAMPMLKEKISRVFCAVLDDTSREDERAIGEQWAKEFGLKATPVGLEKGALLLERV